MAGIMGGKESEINDQTTDVLLESAWFLPSSVRKTSKQCGLSSDSSYRFERGADIGQVIWASNRAAQLIQQLAGVGRTQVEVHEERIKRALLKLGDGIGLGGDGGGFPPRAERLSYINQHLRVRDRQQYALCGHSWTRLAAYS